MNTRPTEIITDSIEQQLIPSGSLVTRHRRDPLKGFLLAANFALACTAGCWAIWTHREWLRMIDAALVVAAVAEFARLMLTRLD